MKQALLAVSFGTSVPRARQDIEAVERVLAAGAPERAFCRAYTSPTIRRILAERGEPVSGLPEALEALAEVDVAEVSHEAGTAVVTLNREIDNGTLKKAVEDQDYKVLDIQ